MPFWLPYNMVKTLKGIQSTVSNMEQKNIMHDILSFSFLNPSVKKGGVTPIMPALQ